MSKKSKPPKRSTPPAKRARPATESAGAGVAWYTPESYARLLELSVDRAERHDTYEEWLDSAEDILVQMQIIGVPLHKVRVDVDRFALWCRLQGKPISRASCSEYVSYLLSTGKAQIIP